jgi:uncharacterized damage-inducible protein DinB
VIQKKPQSPGLRLFSLEGADFMIADQMRRFFAYNTWAWQRVYASVEQLDSEAYYAPRPVFQNSVHTLLVHCMAAEQIWYARCQGESPAALLNPADIADFSALLEEWSHVRHRWANYLQWMSDEDCKQIIEYRTTQGKGYSLRLADILQHVINHATEHRSQLTPILHELGLPTEALDYIRYRLGF